MSTEIRVGLIGAGYIASWHADALVATPGVKIAAVCDLSQTAAQALAAPHGATVFASVAELIQSNSCDAVHILTPPDAHRDLAIECLQGGLHVLVEKPVALTAAETHEIEAVAQAADKRFHAGHNFLGLPSYMRLKQAVADGRLGKISSAEMTWSFPLAPLRSGPFNLWLLREPRNLLLELGPHLVGCAVDLFGTPEVQAATLGKPVALPGDDMRAQGWRIMARAGDVDLYFNIQLVESVDDRSVVVRGSSGVARMDMAADTLVINRENASDLILNPLRRQMDQAWQHLREGAVNATRQTLSLNRRQPYALSFRGMTKAVYGALAARQAPDLRFAGATAVTVMQVLDDALTLLPQNDLCPAGPMVQTRQPKPSAMVIGGTGFIGRALVRRLVQEGRDVRVLSRGRHGPFPDLVDSVETIGLSLHDQEALTASMQGIDQVFNLARALGTSWQDCLQNDVGVAVGIAKAAQAAGVKRLVYTGTIASYDMSDPHAKITEDTGFPEDMSDRNLYARSKAECERQLLQMHHDDGLPLTIARPGIVVGPGGPLQHWGIGRWHGAGALRIWGTGHNALPFVLNDDIAQGLTRMAETPAALGEDFNLIGDVQLSARAYFDAIQSALGAGIRVSSGNLTMFFVADAVKHQIKKHILRRPGLTRPSLADWMSRAHFSTFVNDKPKQILDWTPEPNKDRFIEKAITNANLFGI
ncbi:MAG: NAD-dependent epimerase/dehydratase family protein [Rhodobacteraceae bacterium]|nr:NAD-dependent epimerase/dehydratase family protein [Paracoccaceae bacterium]